MLENAFIPKANSTLVLLEKVIFKILCLSDLLESVFTHTCIYHLIAGHLRKGIASTKSI